MKITISKENYLKTIAEAESEGEPVIAATLARWLHVSPPAVTMAVKRLKRDNLVQVDRKGRIRLTPKGREIATRLLNRHHLIERMLTEVFGMEWYKVHEEAEQLEHAVSEDFEKKLIERLGLDKPCPHGNIVGPDTPELRRKRGLKPLSELAESERAEVTCVYERDRQLLEYLDSLGIKPGVNFQVLQRNYDQTLSLRVGRRKVVIGPEASSKVWVRPLPPSNQPRTRTSKTTDENQAAQQ